MSWQQMTQEQLEKLVEALRAANVPSGEFLNEQGHVVFDYDPEMGLVAPHWSMSVYLTQWREKRTPPNVVTKDGTGKFTP